MKGAPSSEEIEAWISLRERLDPLDRVAFDNQWFFGLPIGFWIMKHTGQTREPYNGKNLHPRDPK